jgi:hypothetical protein
MYTELKRYTPVWSTRFILGDFVCLIGIGVNLFQMLQSESHHM